MVCVIYGKKYSQSCWHEQTDIPASIIYKRVAAIEGVDISQFYLIKCDGKLLQFNDKIDFDCHLKSRVRVFGGKGGFGSMLRAIGARIEKTTNHEACRDLSGRRMRDVNNEKQMADWLKNQNDNEDEKKIRHEAKLERLLNPVHNYDDQGYTTSIQNNASNIDEALKTALQKKKVKSGKLFTAQGKRKSDDETIKDNKKMCMWIGVSDEEEESGNEEDSELLVEDQTLALPPISKPTDNTIQKDSVPIEVSSMKKKEATMKVDIEPVDVSQYASAEELQEVGLDRLKFALLKHGMKCGGPLQERAYRLFLTKTIPIDKLDPSFFVKKKK